MNKDKILELLNRLIMSRKNERISLQIAFFIALLSLIQCTHTNNALAPLTPVLIDMHNSANSLDWTGTYKGIVPCANCDSIITEITLNKPLEYICKTNHAGEKGEEVEEKGNFTWNSAGNTITLLGIKNAPNQYFVGENKLLPLDSVGNKMTGSAADKYFLNKQIPVVLPEIAKLSGTWELNYITRSRIAFDDLYPHKKPTIHFDTINTLISGNTSCNNFGGKFRVNGNAVDFPAPLAMTKMMCFEGKENGENVFVETLQKVNTYAISNDSILNFMIGDVAVMRFAKK